MHMLSRKDLSSAELETLQKSRILTTVTTTKWEVHTSEEAQVCANEWTSGQKQHLTKNGKTILCNKENRSYCSPIKLERKFVLHIGTAGLIGYLSESSKTTKWRYARSSVGTPRPSNKNQNKKLKEGQQSSNELSIASSPGTVRGVHR